VLLHKLFPLEKILPKRAMLLFICRLSLERNHLTILTPGIEKLDICLTKSPFGLIDSDVADWTHFPSLRFHAVGTPFVA
jgi:hypothetical protein